jgi:hypothetical protein
VEDWLHNTDREDSPADAACFALLSRPISMTIRKKGGNQHGKEEERFKKQGGLRKGMSFFLQLLKGCNKPVKYQIENIS